MPQKKYHYLYIITNQINGKYYVGIHSTNNLFDGYFGSGIYLSRAIKKYGKENFTFEIIDFFSTREEAYEAEALLITLDEVNDPMCYNIQPGGIKRKNNPISDLKTSINKKGMVPCKRLSDGAVYYISKKEFDKGGYVGISHGYTHSEDTKLKISKTKKDKICCRNKVTKEIVTISRKEFHKNKDLYEGLTANIKWKKESPLKGRTKETHEHIKRMSETLAGRTNSQHSKFMQKYMSNPENRHKISKVLSGRTKQNTEYVLLANLKKSKGLYITPKGVFYSSLDAAKQLNTTATTIIKLCKDKNDKALSVWSLKQTTCSCLSTRHIGKTPKELGFYFVKIAKDFDRRLLIKV